MSMVFKFRMLSDESDNFVRDYEVLYDMSLLEFHHFLLQSLGYEDCMASFFTADGRWERIHEFTLMDMGEDDTTPMDSVTLGQIFHNNRERMIYHYDMINDRSFYLELTGTARAEEGFEYPRLAFAHLDAPDQYDPSVKGDDHSIFEEVMDDFADFEGDENASDDF